MAKKTVRDVEVRGKRVLVRVDFNVPLDPSSGAITDDSRIRACLPTINYLVERGAKVILCSHLGRPGGRIVEKLCLTPVAERLARLLGRPVLTTRDSVGSEVEQAAMSLQDGGVLLLENLRFHPEEEKNDTSFARKLASLAELYVSDAFGTVHRSHASTVGVASFLPAVAGFLLERELVMLGNTLHNASAPFAALVGGAKVSDKMGVLENILHRIDALLIGGGMASTFLKAEGQGVGRSRVEEDKLDFASGLIEKGQARSIRLLLPVDVVVGPSLEATDGTQVVPVTQVPADGVIGDIGPQTVELFSAQLRKCKTIFWNGPMGVFESPAYAQGTRAMARLLAELEATTIVGGGSSAEVVEELGLTEKMTHVSTGGGASLEFLEGKTLPGVAVLE
ncbi:MAG: phosphoglycerate kinase, partial [Dehalococcoidia bacterium]